MKLQMLWSCLVIASSTIGLVLLIRRKQRITQFAWFGWILFYIIGFTLGISAFFFQKIVGFCAVSFGLAIIKGTHDDFKKYPSNKWTSAYQSQLMGYIAGVGALLCGIVRIWLCFYK